MNDQPEKQAGKTKKQHYVPQFYLRQWTDNDGCFYPTRIESKEPPNIKIFDRKSTPSNYCFENYFYAQHTGREDDVSQLIEKSFAEIESVFHIELPKLEAKILNNEQITFWDKFHLAEFMVFLWIRGKKHRQESQKMTNEVVKEINKHWGAQYVGKNSELKKDMEKMGVSEHEFIEFLEKGEYTVDFGNMHHMSLIKDSEGFSNLLSAKHWKAYISQEGEFITTDAPYRDISLSNKWWGNDFLSREQSFVLSPRIFIVASYPRNQSGKNFFRKNISDDRFRIQGINLHSLMNAVRFGFHKEKSLVEELCEYAKFRYKFKEKLF